MYMKLLQRLSVILICFALTKEALANDSSELTIAVSDIPNLISEDSNDYGPYNHILGEMSDLKFDLLYTPPARAELLFEKKQVDCLFPASVATMSGKNKLIQSAAFDRVQAYLFTSKPYVDISEYKRKAIAIRRGFAYGNIRQKFPAYYVELGSDVLTLEFLKLDRVEGVIGYLSDVRSASKLVATSLPYFNVKSPAYTAEDAIVCRESKDSLDLVGGVNSRLKEMKRTGLLQQLLSNE